MRLEGANPHARGFGEALLAGKSNYFIGNDRRLWRTNVPNFARVRYRNVYPGIDVVYYGRGNDVEFDFVVAPGADPRRIELAMSGSDLKLIVPRIYQGDREIEGRAVRTGDRVRFELAQYDRTRSLVIDPVIGFAALVGGGSSDVATAIAVDQTGASYITGFSNSLNFPSRVPPVYFGGSHAFVVKLSPDGSTVLYSSYLGGGHGSCISNPCNPVNLNTSDTANAIAVDGSGNAYVAGQTTSPDFPAVNPVQPFRGGLSGFVTKFGANGSVIFYSTFLGGSGPNNAHGIAVDASGNAYVTGETTTDDFPVRAALQPTHLGHLDAFLTKFSPGGSIVFSTYFGGVTDDAALGIALGADGSIYLTGWTYSVDFPIINALRPYPLGGGDAFIAKFTPDGSGLVWSTLLGGTGVDAGTAIAVDGAGNVFVTGRTSSRDMATVNAFQGSNTNPLVMKSVDGGTSFAAADAGIPLNISSLAVDPTNAAVVYAGTNGVFKTQDSGATWTNVLDKGVGYLAIDPSATSTLYAGGYGSIFKTTDGGATWKELKYGGARAQVLVVDPKNSSVVYAGSGGGANIDGLYKSTDGGQTWTTTSSSSGSGSAVKALAIDPSNSQVLYASIGNAFRKSTDGGANWSGPLQFGSGPITTEQIVTDGSGAIYVNYTGFLGPAILKSTDRGDSWTAIFHAADLTPSTGTVPQFGWLAADPSQPSTLYLATSVGLVKTSDGFAQWFVANQVGTLTSLAAASGSIYATSPTASDVFVAKLNADAQSYAYVTYLGGNGQNSGTAIAVDGSGNAYVGGATMANNFPLKNTFAGSRFVQNNGFVSKFAPDGSSLVYSSYVGAPVAGLTLGPDGGVHVTGGWTAPTFFTIQPTLPYHTDNVFRSDDGGGSWSGSTISGFAGGFLGQFVIDPQNSNHLFVAAAGRAFVSNDAGRSWSAAFDQFVSSVLIDPHTPSTVLFGANTGILKSTDGGITFHATQNAPFSPLWIVADPRNPGTYYTGGYPAAGNRTFFKSVDGGESWQPLTTPTGVTSPVSWMAVDSQSVVYAVTGRVFKSTDGGVFWTQLINAPNAASLIPDPFNPSILYLVGTSQFANGAGLFRSLDGGATFSVLNADVRTLAIDPVSGTMYAGSQHGGVLKSADHGNTWTATGLSIPLVTAIAVDPSTPGRVFAETTTDPVDVFVLKIVN
jgi:photosystem II stability/assembly factor-like uncharacterized protein